MALTEGGGIKWMKFLPVLDNVKFYDNQAIYGKNQASFPLRMRFIFSNKGQ